MPIQPPQHRLPPRFASIVPLLADGLTNEDIAGTLTISKHTAEKYVSELKLRLGARTGCLE